MNDGEENNQQLIWEGWIFTPLMIDESYFFFFSSLLIFLYCHTSTSGRKLPQCFPEPFSHSANEVVTLECH